MDNRYYVYGHYTLGTNNLFYIGKGTGIRSKSVANRSVAWKTVSLDGWYSVILYSGLTNSQALDKEIHLIDILKDKIINVKTVNRSTDLDVNLLNERFYYDPLSPSGLRWRCWNRQYNHCRRDMGDIAGGESRKGLVLMYLVSFGINKQLVACSRVVWTILKGKIKDFHIIDHIDGNPLNNSIENLREVSPKTNSRNTRLRSDSPTGVHGISIVTLKKGIRYTAKYINGTPFSKQFNTNKLGLIPAFYLAQQWRIDRIKELNAQGAGYTARHGT